MQEDKKKLFGKIGIGAELAFFFSAGKKGVVDNDRLAAFSRTKSGRLNYRMFFGRKKEKQEKGDIQV